MCYVNNMKRIIPVILFLLTLTGCYNSGEPRERVLKIYNWADYIGEVQNHCIFRNTSL